jgi:hypothetical protein
MERYEQLLAENKLLFSCDIVKEKLEKAYKMTIISFVKLIDMSRQVYVRNPLSTENVMSRN